MIAEVEIIAGGPFRAVAQARKLLKGSAPNVFELEGYNSYNWDVVHRGFQTGEPFYPVSLAHRTGRMSLRRSRPPRRG